jgi:hypothetical protein
LVDAAITGGTYDLDTIVFEIARVLSEDIVSGTATTTYFDKSGSVTITAHNMTTNAVPGSFTIAYLELGSSLTRTASGTFMLSISCCPHVPNDYNNFLITHVITQSFIPKPIW